MLQHLVESSNLVNENGQRANVHFYYLISTWIPSHGREVVAGVVECRSRNLVILKTRCEEEQMDIKTVVTESPHVGMEICLLEDSECPECSEVVLLRVPVVLVVVVLALTHLHSFLEDDDKYGTNSEVESWMLSSNPRSSLLIGKK
ncbi:hypothetical protein TNCV_2596471 [Trichonephila clavipes]|nr:hypothetical protein TNCV_2596471 [Trichonephila clavipes]